MRLPGETCGHLEHTHITSSHHITTGEGGEEEEDKETHAADGQTPRPRLPMGFHVLTSTSMLCEGEEEEEEGSRGRCV
jgi:hypothetical protein